MKYVAKTGWQTRPLGEVCKLINGRAYKKPEFLNAGPYPVLRVGNFFTNDHWYYSDLELDQEKYCDNGDLLYAWSASLGPRIWKGGKVIYHYHIWKVLPSDRLDRDFLYYFLDWDKDLIKKEQGSGATMIHVSKGSMEARAIPFPPLEEQKRIVAILDEAFEGLDRARAHAEANQQNARELYDETEARLFRDISSGSTETTLGELASFRNGLNYSRSSRGDAVKVVGVGDFQDNFTIPTEKLSFARIDGQLDDDDKLFAGDILAVRSNGNRQLIGRTMLMPESDEPTSFSGFTIRIRLNAKDVMPEYVCSYLRTKTVREKLTAGGGGANISNLNQRILSSFPISYPDENGQRDTLGRLEELRENSKRLREVYIQKLQNIDDLRQSLLQRAFTGQLTRREAA